MGIPDMARHTMTAVALEILIDRYYNAEPYDARAPDRTPLSEAETNAFDFLFDEGLICDAEGSTDGGGSMQRMRATSVTERGRVHIEALLAAPLPKASWKSSITKE